MKIRLFSLAVLLTSLIVARAEDGFKPLFNGKDFTGWYLVSGSKRLNNDTNRLFSIHDGMVHMYQYAPDKSKQNFGYMVTEKEYSNYHLRFEYKWGTKKFSGKVDKKRDCGVLIHCIGPDGVWPKSIECQVQEGDTGDIFTVRTRATITVDPATLKVTEPDNSPAPYFKDGGIPTVQGATNGVRRVHHARGDFEKDGWNKVDIFVNGDSAHYLVNGKLDNGFTHLEHVVNGKWVPLTKGKILFQQEGAEVMYRNIEIKELDDAKTR
jgi:hypothetical protein